MVSLWCTPQPRTGHTQKHPSLFLFTPSTGFPFSLPPPNALQPTMTPLTAFLYDHTNTSAPCRGEGSFLLLQCNTTLPPQKKKELNTCTQLLRVMLPISSPTRDLVTWYAPQIPPPYPERDIPKFGVVLASSWYAISSLPFIGGIPRIGMVSVHF